MKNGSSVRRKKSGASSIPAKRARRVRTLQRYLKAYGPGIDGGRLRAAFAKRAGTTLPYLVHLAWGFRQASTELAIKIEQASHGLVTLEDMRPDLDWLYLARRKARAVEREVARRTAAKQGTPAATA